MNKFLIPILFLLSFTINAQKRDIIYRIAYDSYPAGGYYYGISVLYLRDDNTYRLSVQEYNSKKMARKNVLRNSENEFGTWKMLDDTLFCSGDKTKNPMKFIKVNNKRIFFLIDDVERSKEYWKKIKY